HLLNTAGQLVATLERVQLALLFLEEEADALALLLVEIGTLLEALGTADVQLIEPEARGLLEHDLVVLVRAQQAATQRIFQLLLIQDGGDAGNHRPELVGNRAVVTAFDLAVFLVENLAFVVRHAGAAAEALRGGHNAFHTAGNFQAVVLDVFTGPAEDR